MPVSPMMGFDEGGSSVEPMPTRPMSSLQSVPSGGSAEGETVQQAFAKDILQGLSQRNFIFTIADPNVADCPLTFVSDAFCEFTGYSREECVGKNCRFLQGPETNRQTVDDLKKALLAGEEHRCSLVNYKKDGTKFWNELHCCPVKDKDTDAITFIVGVQQEVDENGKPLEETMPTRAKDIVSALSQQQDQPPALDYAGALGALQLEQVVCVSNPQMPDCPIIYVNQKFYDLTQYGPAEVIGRNCRFLQGPETDPDDVSEIRTAVKTGLAVTTCLLNYKKDGTPFWNHLHIEPVYARSGELQYFVASQYDVTSLMDEAIQLVARGQQPEGASTSLGAAIKQQFGNDGGVEEHQDDALLTVISNLPSDSNRGLIKEGKRATMPSGTDSPLEAS